MTITLAAPHYLELEKKHLGKKTFLINFLKSHGYVKFAEFSYTMNSESC